LTEVAHRFEDSAGYECFMGRWSRAVGVIFLDWMAPPAGGRWLDVGCGTGIFTELILDTCSPSAVFAIDPEQAQIDYAKRQPVAGRANFQTADAQALPFPDGTFDVVASALAINFIPDRARALAEMRRTLRGGGVAGGYVWDLAAERSPSWPLRRGLREIGVHVPQVPGTADSTLGSLEAFFEAAGFEKVRSRSIDVTVVFADFDAFWRAQAAGYSPITKLVAELPTSDHARLMEAVRAALPVVPGGGIAYSARANAIRARYR
jgi:SAM-dependent methyltransferase